MNNIRVETLLSTNKHEFVKRLESELCDKFSCEIKNLPLNYGYDQNQGLLYFIANDMIDSYYMAYLDDKFRSACGGIIRNFNDEKIYQGQWRFFNVKDRLKKFTGLDLKNGHNILYMTSMIQIERAIKNNCSKYIISYNLQNKRLHDMHIKYQFKQAFGPDHGFVSSMNPVYFNGVPQLLLTKELKNEF